MFVRPYKCLECAKKGVTASQDQHNQVQISSVDDVIPLPKNPTSQFKPWTINFKRKTKKEKMPLKEQTFGESYFYEGAGI